VHRYGAPRLTRENTTLAKSGYAEDLAQQYCSPNREFEFAKLLRVLAGRYAQCRLINVHQRKGMVMKYDAAYLILLYLLGLSGCASTPTTIQPELQFGWVVIGEENGNRLIIPNHDVIPAYNIYRQGKNDTTFVFITKEKRPNLPMRFQVTQYGIEWVDKEYKAPVKYKVMGLKDDGTEWFQVNLEYRTAKDKAK
jgi:hypothetical protein